MRGVWRARQIQVPIPVAVRERLPENHVDPVILEHGDHIQHLLEYYMGKNTQERQEFIINNLRVELDVEEINN